MKTALRFAVLIVGLAGVTVFHVPLPGQPPSAPSMAIK